MVAGLPVFLMVAGLASVPASVSVSAVQQANAEAKAENLLITQADEAMDAKNWQAAEAPLQKLVSMNPGRWEYRQSLGNVQLNLGKYQEALGSFESALKAAQKATDSKGKYRNAIAMMLTDEGDIYLKLKRNQDAIAAFTKAAEMSTNPGVAWFNLCATEYNMGDMANAAKSCDKAIAADPNRADAYFIKGSALYGNGSLDANNKWVVPAGTVEALHSYLQLAPTGGHAADVQAMLDALK